eukprot:5521363-Pleurochrysis_carterae.AAC.1
MTKIFTKGTGPPSCQRKWEQILGTPIDWKKVWRTLQNPITNPYDSKTWLRLAHRGLRLNNNDKTTDSKACRLCSHHTESHAHLLTCSTLNVTKRSPPAGTPASAGNGHGLKRIRIPEHMAHMPRRTRQITK